MIKLRTIFLLILLSLTSCVDKTNTELKSSLSPITENNFKASEMNYKTFHYSGGGMIIVNTTKDSLEVEYYKSQIDLNNKYFAN